MGKEYAILLSAKIKSDKEFKDSYNHNMRIYDVVNADKMRTHLNTEPVSLNGRTYKDVYEEAEYQMRIHGAITKKVRKDAVRGVELILRYSHEANSRINQEEWVNENVKWLRDTFNPPGMVANVNGEQIPIDNVKSVIVHNDEGVPHIHAFIVPIDDKGHLNSQYYFGGRQKFMDMQNSYAKAMSKFGLERGEYKSMATPEKVSRYLTQITKATDAQLPPPEKEETVEEYYQRANITYQNEKIQHRHEIVQQNQENIRLRSEMLQRFEQTHQESWEAMKKLRKLARQLGVEELDHYGMERIRSAVMNYEALQQAVEEEPEKERIMSRAAEIMAESAIVVNDRKRKRKKKQYELEEPER